MKNSEENLILVKSKAFALRIINLYKYLCEEKKEFVLSEQIVRWGTSIGAKVKGGSLAQSKADLAGKLSIALREAGETEYWLELLHESNYIEKNAFTSIYTDNKELIKILTSILKTTRNQ